MKKVILTLSILYFFFNSTMGQSVGIGTTTPDISALLEVSSTSKGLLLPRMTAAQRALITSPKAGLIIYQTDGTKGLYIYNGSTWATADASGNFVDLVNPQSINGVKTFASDIYASGVRVGLGGGSFATNTAVGVNVLNINNAGDANSAVGYQSLFYNTSGSGNSANGFASLYTNITGNDNTAIGRAALYANQFGDNNTAAGSFALYSNFDGYSNVAVGAKTMYKGMHNKYCIAIGDSALYNNYADKSVAIGSKALFANTSGVNNSGVGYMALADNISGGSNTAVGYQSLTNNTVGNGSTAIGFNSLLQNTSGGGNTAVGFDALVNDTTGSFNTSSGYTSLVLNTSGSYNAAHGYRALNSNTNGDYNTALGTDALYSNTQGDMNTALGYSADVAGTNLSNATAVGSKSSVACSNCLVLGSIVGLNNALNSVNVGIGLNIPLSPMHIKQSNDVYPMNGGGLRLERKLNTNHWDIGTDTGDDLDFTFNGATRGYINHVSGVYTVTSDIRMKKDIGLIGTVMPAVMQLQAKTYHYKDNDKDAVLSYGFIAQEVEKLFPDFVTTKGPDNMKAVAYQNFSVIAIKAIQEQQTALQKQQAEIDLLKAMVEELRNRK